MILGVWEDAAEVMEQEPYYIDTKPPHTATQTKDKDKPNLSLLQFDQQEYTLSVNSHVSIDEPEASFRWCFKLTRCDCFSSCGSGSIHGLCSRSNAEKVS